MSFTHNLKRYTPTSYRFNLQKRLQSSISLTLFAHIYNTKAYVLRFFLTVKHMYVLKYTHVRHDMVINTLKIQHDFLKILFHIIP